MKNQSVAKNLKYQRKLKGYSQEDLSEKTNVAIRTIQRIEKSEVNPHLQTVKLLAAALEIEVDDLLVLENPKEETIQSKWLLIMHGAPLIGIMVPVFNILIPLFLWIHKRGDNDIYATHGRKILNFHITFSILFILAFIALLTIEGYGFLFYISVIPLAVILIIINVLMAVNSQKCWYPAIPFFGNKNSNVSKSLGSLMVLGSLALGSCSVDSPPLITRLDGSVISQDSLAIKIEQLMKDARVQGIGVSLFESNKVAFQRTFGYKNWEEKEPLTDSTNMYGASLSKAVFSVLVMKLVEEDVIDLDIPLESYLPKKIYEYEPLTRWHDNFSDLETDTLYHKITARMCLNNTTGFPNWRWFEPDQKLRVKFEPGSRYSYSGEGFVYLQVILEKILGRGLEELAQERLFEPLKMANSSYEWQSTFDNDFAFGHWPDGTLYQKDTDNEPRAGSTLETTTNDYTTFLEAVLQNKILTQDSWDEIFKSQIRIRSVKQFGLLSLTDSTLNDAIELSYGLGWGVLKSPYGRGVFKEGGGDGFHHYTILYPEVGKGIMLMTNGDNAKGIFKELLEVALGDTYTPWEWEGYYPYEVLENSSP